MKEHTHQIYLAHVVFIVFLQEHQYFPINRHYPFLELKVQYLNIQYHTTIKGLTRAVLQPLFWLWFSFKSCLLFSQILGCLTLKKNVEVVFHFQKMSRSSSILNKI